MSSLNDTCSCSWRAIWCLQDIESTCASPPTPLFFLRKKKKGKRRSSFLSKMGRNSMLYGRFPNNMFFHFYRLMEACCRWWNSRWFVELVGVGNTDIQGGFWVEVHVCIYLFMAWQEWIGTFKIKGRKWSSETWRSVMKLGERSLGFETRKYEGRDKVWQYGSWE